MKVNCFKIGIFILVINLFVACNRNKPFPSNPVLTDLAIPVTLGVDSTLIHLSDFISDSKLIDSISVDKAFTQKYDKEKGELLLINASIGTPTQSILVIWSNGYSYDVLLRKSQKISVELQYVHKGKKPIQVQVAGDLNSWNPATSEFKFIEGRWITKLWLNPGTYQYKLVVDGKWINDPANPTTASNGIGGINSVLSVNKPKGVSPKLATLEFKESSVKILLVNNPTKVFAFWQNHLLGKENISVSENELSIKIPKQAKSNTHSYIRVFASNSNAESNDLLIPLREGKLPQNLEEAGLNRPETQIMYFLLVDRFNNGNKSNDKPVIDKDVDFKSNYQGGDLAGITQKIKDGYFDSLGFNTIWVSPIFQNPEIAYTEYPAPHRKFSGYHGYWPTSLKKIDHRFGNDDSFKELISEAHSRKQRVVMDYVANHIHEEHPISKLHPDWLTPLVLNDGRKNIRIWDEQRLTTWFDTFLPDLDYSNPVVINAMTDTALYWVKNFGVDGFRHDATKHIHEEFWRTLTKKIKNETASSQHHLYQVGETFGSRELINSYVNSGEMDGQFDFNLYFDARSVFLDEHESFSKLDASLQSTFAYYGHHHLMANISGNHDLPRFISFAGGNLTQKEDDKEAGWNRKIEVTDTSGYLKLAQLEAFMFTIPGIPVMYYGDEIGMPGAGDPDNRRMMKFDGLSVWEAKTKNIVSLLAKLRKISPELIYGEYELIEANLGGYVFMRTLFGKASIVVFNKTQNTREFTFAIPERYKNKLFFAYFGSPTIKVKEVINVKVKPLGFDVISLR